MKNAIWFLSRVLEARKGEFEFWVDNLMVEVVNEAGFVTVRVVGDEDPLFVLYVGSILDARPAADFIVRRAAEELRVAGRVKHGVVEPRLTLRRQPGQDAVDSILAAI